jgi:hypothetical protein
MQLTLQRSLRKESFDAVSFSETKKK